MGSGRKDVNFSGLDPLLRQVAVHLEIPTPFN